VAYAYTIYTDNLTAITAHAISFTASL